MVETISSIERTARKDHEDNAGTWIRECLSYLRNSGELTFSELRSIAKLKANGWKILKGERYVDSTIKQDRELYRFRCKPEINAICERLDMYIDC